MKNKKYKVFVDRPGCGWEEIVTAQTKENALKIANKKHRNDTAILSDVYEVDMTSVKNLLDKISNEMSLIGRRYVFDTTLEEEINFAKKYLQKFKDTGYIKDFSIDEKSSTINNIVCNIKPISSNS